MIYPWVAMLDPRTETDPDRLRQMAVLLEQENGRLHTELKRLAKKVADLEGANAQQVIDGVLTKLPESSKSRRNKSERRRRQRRPTKNEKKKRTEFGNRPQPELDIEEVELKLEGEACTCESCGKPLQAMAGQSEDAEYVDVVERRFVLKRIHRQKYRKSCECEQPIVTAPQPAEPETLGGRYSIAFAASVATEKYQNHMPLRRQQRKMAGEGLEVTAQSLFACLWALCHRVSATYDALQHEVKRATTVHIDETGWPALNAADETRQLWGMTSEHGAYYRLLDNRSHEGAKLMLGDYSGIVLSDGLKVYDKASRESDWSQAGCWAHARRYLVECEPNFPEVTEPLDWIDELFRIEREVDEAPNEERLAIRTRRRDQESRPIANKLKVWLFAARPPAGTDLHTAVHYILGQWDKLAVFLDEPAVPMSNNAAERALRAGVIGRKNYNGTRSKRGELVTATLYSLIETARICGLKPGDYLVAVAKHDLLHPGEPLLPADYLRRSQPA